MNKHKRLLSFALALAMILSLFPLSAIATDEGSVEITHIETCVEGCADESCACACHEVVIIADDIEKLCDKCNATKTAENAIKHEPTCEKVLYVAPVCTGDPATCTIENCECKQPAEPVCTGDPATCEIENCACKQPAEPVCTGDPATCEIENCACKQPAAPVCTGDPATCEIENCECKQPAAPEKTFAEGLLEINNLSDLLIAALEDEMALLDLTLEEINALRAHAEALYAAIENPSEQDGWDLDDFLATTEMLPNYRAENACPDCGVVGEHAEDCPWLQMAMMPSSGPVSADNYSGTWNLTGDILVNGRITIKSGTTLTINGNGHSIKRNNGTIDIFRVREGGTLIIKNATIDGLNKSYNGAAIYLEADDNSGTATLTLDNVTIKDFKRSSGYGAGIKLGDDNSYANRVDVTIEDCVIDNCDAPEGSAIMMHNYLNGDILLKNTIVQNCDSTSSYAGNIRTQGSANCKLTIDGCTIKDNTSTNNGGGVYWNASGDNSHMHITGGTVIDNNYAPNGGGIFISGKSAAIDNTTIKNNNATYGGGILVQPYDYGSNGSSASLTLGENTLIDDNDATSQGGGIHMQIISGSTPENSTFKLEVNNGVTIQNNNAPDGAGIAVTQEFKGNYKNKYHCYVDIKGGTISGNTASNNGGGIYVKRAYGNNGTNFDLKVNISGGNIYGNTAVADGGALYLTDNATNSKAMVTVSGGDIGTNGKNTAVNGGAIYLNNGSFTMSNGTISKNEATTDGGAVYVTGGNFTMSGGTVSGNKASRNGGAVYVTGGNATMSGGTMAANSAAASGGALFVNRGKFTMTGGTIGGEEESAANTAVNGGGVYVDGDTSNTATGTFEMISGKLLSNKATNNGGGACVNNGTAIIGVSGCTGEGDKHSVTHTGLAHPLVQDNVASNNGGGVALTGTGTMNMYCGEITSNDALNRGRGWNVYMQNGTFNYHGGDIGALESPELVIIGGRLVNHKLTNGDVTLKYYHCNDTDVFPGAHEDDLAVKSATASKGSWFNLPDGEQYWTAPKGYRFFGWTFNGPNSAAAQQNVRNKNHYQPLGSPIQGLDTRDDNSADNILHMYALWAPDTSTITYKGSYYDGKFTEEGLNSTNPDTYKFSTSDYEIVLNSPTKPGYEFKGWHYYQNEGQNANWGVEPDYKSGTTDKNYSNLNYESDTMGFLPVEESGDNAGKCVLNVEATNFGALTLIAEFEELEVTINYVVEGPEGCGTVNPTSETVHMATGTVTGSVATATNSNYRFVGWYADEGCTTQLTMDTKYTPSKNADGLWESATYYAKFEWNLTTMKISKTVTGSVYDSNDTFRFQVKDDTGAVIANVTLKAGESVTISNVTVGKTYTVTELSSSNRYDAVDAEQEIEIAPPDAENEVSFTNTEAEGKWLGATAVETNEFNNSNSGILQRIFGN